MKLLRVYIGIIVVLILVYISGVVTIQQVGEDKVDLTYMNTIVKNVERELAQGHVVDDGKSYRLLSRDSDKYQTRITEAIHKDAVILNVMRNDELYGVVIFDKDYRQMSETKKKLLIFLTVIFATLLIIVLGSFFYVYQNILRPFAKLKMFAQRVAAGDLEFTINMDKKNYFGAYTESFDLMREELMRAKQGEYEANRSKKELVASISHDIKSPVATILAICEVLQIKLQGDENIGRIRTIATKADVINHLMNDMFQSTLEELHVLKIVPREESSEILARAVEDSNIQGRVISQEVPDCLVECDKLRIVQVIDNIITNSYKYSNGIVYVTYCFKEGYLLMKIRDEGEGVSDEELPLLYEKFYRGSNSSQENGSGLGLYLAKVFMEGMHGFIDCYNEDGFVVELRLKLI